MDELVVDGEKYISSKRAARLSGYAKDYIGQLCRAGKIDAKMVGRSWYVKESAIKEHRKTFQGTPVVDETLWKEGKEGLEFKGFGTAADPSKPRLTEEHIKINYEHDDRPVMPLVGAKATASPTPVDDEPVEEEPDTSKQPDEVTPAEEPLDAAAQGDGQESVVQTPDLTEPKSETISVPDYAGPREEPPSDTAPAEPRQEPRPVRRTSLMRWVVVGCVLLAGLVAFVESHSVYTATAEGFQRADSGVGLWNPVADLRSAFSDAR